MKMGIRIKKNRQQLINLITTLFFFSSSISLACSIEVTIVTLDSLTGENLNNHVILIDGKESYYSDKETNISKFVLDCSKKKVYEIRIAATASYEESKFNIEIPTECKDTTIIVKLLYRFHPRQLPVFFFNKNEVSPDTANFKNAMEATEYVCKTYKNDKLIFQINGNFYPDRNRLDDTLIIIQRINYVKSLLIANGIDTNKIEISNLISSPYVILHKEEINEYFKFKDVLNQEYIDKLPPEIRGGAEKYNQRIFVTLRKNAKSKKSG